MTQAFTHAIASPASFAQNPALATNIAIQGSARDPIVILVEDTSFYILRNFGLDWIDYKACRVVCSFWQKFLDRMAKEDSLVQQQSMSKDLANIQKMMEPLLAEETNLSVAYVFLSIAGHRERLLHLFQEMENQSSVNETLSSIQEQERRNETFYNLFKAATHLSIALRQPLDNLLYGTPHAPFPKSFLHHPGKEKEKVKKALNQMLLERRTEKALAFIEACEEHQKDLVHNFVHHALPEEIDEGPLVFLDGLIAQIGVEEAIENVCNIRNFERRRKTFGQLMQGIARFTMNAGQITGEQAHSWLEALSAKLSQMHDVEKSPCPQLRALFIVHGLTIAAVVHKRQKHIALEPLFAILKDHIVQMHDQTQSYGEENPTPLIQILSQNLCTLYFENGTQFHHDNQMRLLAFLTPLHRSLRTAIIYELNSELINDFTQSITDEEDLDALKEQWELMCMLDELSGPDSSMDSLIECLLARFLEDPSVLQNLMMNEAFCLLPHHIAILFKHKPNALYDIVKEHIGFEESEESDSVAVRFDENEELSDGESLAIGHPSVVQEGEADSIEVDEASFDMESDCIIFENSCALVRIIGELLQKEKAIDTIKEMMGCVPETWPIAEQIQTILESFLETHPHA